MAAHLLRKRFRPHRGLHRSSVTELWHVDSIEGWNADSTSSFVFQQIPRVIGQSHPDIGEAICTDFALDEQISLTDALVLVFFSTNHSEVRRFRTSSTRGFTGSVRVPYWTNTNGRWTLSYAYDQREHVRRVETRYVRNGSLTDAMIATITSLVGSVFRFPEPNGIPFLLKSPSIMDYAPGQSRLIYTFETSCRCVAMPAGTLPGQNQALPALDYLQEWFAAEGGTAAPLSIVARPWQSRYFAALQSQLPFLL